MAIWEKVLKALRNIQVKGYVFMGILTMAKDSPMFAQMAQKRLSEQFEKNYLRTTMLKGEFYGMGSFMESLVRPEYFDV